MGNIHTCGPSEAMIVSGGCAGGSEKKVTVVGDWSWAWWCVTDVQKLTLQTMTLEPQCIEVETSEA